MPGLRPPKLQGLTLYDCVVPGDSRAYRDLSSPDTLSITSCRSPDGVPITTLDLPVKHLSIR
ncbi:hypothetical protein [Streptomyces sp. NPDC088794]|uniref:hypothetical protein n=1 Tax=Streptomyces sp. NPDC088794 TaxID=3365902 RepID=UPI00380C81B1